MGQQQQAQAAPAAQKPMDGDGAEQWKCSCGNVATGKFCQNCGAKKPEPQPAAGGWKCRCGAVASGKFCPECGSSRPADTDGWTCSCGAVNKDVYKRQCTGCAGSVTAFEGTDLGCHRHRNRHGDRKTGSLRLRRLFSDHGAG